jgi:uncharacterized protein YfbU (UPF0304 family)
MAIASSRTLLQKESVSGKFDGNKDDFEHSKILWGKAEKLLEAKKFKPHRYEIRSGGLNGILSGLEDLKDSKVSGIKIVYRIYDLQ